MSRRLFLSLLVIATCGVLTYLGASEGLMLAGGGPCLIIINEGNAAYGAIEGYETRHGSTSAIARLKAAITASCSLTSYASILKKIDGAELAGAVLNKIIAFHRTAIEVFRAPTLDPGYNVNDEAIRLEKYNRRLVELAADETYPEP